MNILHVVGARPNFIKAAPVYAALSKKKLGQTLIHTGQHYDPTMSEVFFKPLGLPDPEINLGIGSGSHTYQTAQMMLRLEPFLLECRPDWILVYGDVNSTVAAALVASRLGLRLAHVEAGLRSRDRTMPEEHNRIATDHLADLLLTPSEDADRNLTNEGISKERIRRVGNVMIDSLKRLLPRARKLKVLGFSGGFGAFVLVTLHRPSNVDGEKRLAALMDCLEEIAQEAPVVFPVHPRTRQNLKGRPAGRIQFTDPLGYLEFLALQSRAALVITDSGGIQEETTYLGIPCLTVRENTERPVTVSLGTNELVGGDLSRLKQRAIQILRGDRKPGKIPPLWDGHAAERIADELCRTA